MKDKIIKILNDIDEDIVEFDGDDLIEGGIIDSFTIIEILTDLEEEFKITIAKEDVTVENFKSIDAICSLVKKSL